MTKVSAVEARRRLGTLLNIVSLRNEEIIIERAGKSVAKLSACTGESSTRGRSGKTDFRKARGLGRDLWRQLDTENYVAKERDEWD